MSVRSLIQFFSTFTNLPVNPEDVRDQIIELGVQDEIIFADVDIDPAILQGMLVRFRTLSPPYQNPKRCSLVLYSNRLSPEWQRLVCCKEMIHIFDAPGMATSSRGDLSNLVDRLPAALTERPTPENIQAIMDRIAVYQALAILMPHEIREDYIPSYKAGRINDAWVARWAGLPEEFVSLLMSDEWDAMREQLIIL